MSNEIRGLLLLSDAYKRLMRVHTIVDDERFILPILKQDQFSDLRLSSGIYRGAKDSNANEVIVSLLGSDIGEPSAYYVLSNLYNVVRPLIKYGEAIIITNPQQMSSVLDVDREENFDTTAITYARERNFGSYPLYLTKSPFNLDLAELRLRIRGSTKMWISGYLNQMHKEFSASFSP